MPLGYNDFEEPGAPADSVVVGDTVVASHQLLVSDTLRREFASKGIRYLAVRSDSSTTVPAIVCRPGGAAPVWFLVKGQIGHPDGMSVARSDSISLARSGSISRATAPSRTEALRACRELTAEAADVENSPCLRIEVSRGELEIFGAKLHLGGPRGAQTLLRDNVFAWIAVFLLLFNYVFLDVNKSSLHGFYRDRLSKLYLFRMTSGAETDHDDALKPSQLELGRGTSGTTEHNDAQKLSQLNQEGSVAPYHIVNTTLNLQGERVETVHGRASDFFFFSKHFCGGPHTGYCRTEDMEAWDGHVNLGTAMAISAAAAAPNMGATTNRSLVFIMTMLNFRLGYWLPNPISVNQGMGLLHKAQAVVRQFWRTGSVMRPGSSRLLNEAMGGLNARGKMINLSDGGHLENLATYELLRRKCRTIVTIDGEADPHLTFSGLVTLIRLAKIDLGIHIEIHLDLIQWLKDDTTQAHFAIGTIHYGENEKGKLVYVKTSITGDEGPFIRKYRADNPPFPHETTADQFFDETQFEAYRALGAHIGQEMARDAKDEDVHGFQDVPPSRRSEVRP